MNTYGGHLLLFLVILGFKLSTLSLYAQNSLHSEHATNNAISKAKLRI